MKRHATYNDISKANSTIEYITHQTFGPWLTKFPEVMDTLMELSYLEHNLPEISHTDYVFHIFAIESYHQAPLSFTSINLLMECGLYHDSLILVRSMIENLVKCKYFNHYKDQLEPFEKTGKDKNNKRITISQMWKFVAEENAYKKVYSHLSKLAHKNLFTSQPNMHMTLNFEKNIQLIPVFNQQLAGAIINYTMYLIYGYLNLAPSFIPYNYTAANNDFLITYKTKTDEFHQLIKNHRLQFPQKEEWCSIMEKIVSL